VPEKPDTRAEKSRSPWVGTIGVEGTYAQSLLDFTGAGRLKGTKLDSTGPTETPNHTGF
jgi:hypothetical protein